MVAQTGTLPIIWHVCDTSGIVGCLLSFTHGTTLHWRWSAADQSTSTKSPPAPTRGPPADFSRHISKMTTCPWQVKCSMNNITVEIIKTCLKINPIFSLRRLLLCASAQRHERLSFQKDAVWLLLLWKHFLIINAISSSKMRPPLESSIQI